MKELISIIERNIQIENWINDNKKEKDQNFTLSIALDLIFIYTHFCNLKLNLGMFVPAVIVNAKWMALEEPENFKAYIKGNYSTSSKSELLLLQQYEIAQNNVLFEGFTYVKQELWFGFNMIYCSKFRNGFTTIENLVKYKPTLTVKGLEISGLDK